MDVQIAWEIITSYKEIEIIQGTIVIPNELEESADLTEALDYMFWEWDYAILTRDDYEVNVERMERKK